MPTLSTFIRENSEEILLEWEAFARQLPMGAEMDVAALRDHAKAMLGVIARDLDMPQTNREQAEKAHGESDADQRVAPTAASEHGLGRAESGFTVEHMVAEFRALRASVIRLWTRQQGHAGAAELDDMTRFNEAIDQAIAESLTRFTRNIDQTKERFLAILGHDLRTPLGAIITSTQFMLDTGDLEEPHLTLVNGIASSSRRMNSMVADLLDLARTRFGDAIPIVRAEMDAGRMLRDVVAEVAAAEPGSRLEVETAGDLRGTWDLARLTQAATNLVCNAAQHGSNDYPIAIIARGEAAEVVITVWNTGPVIPEEQMERLFDPMKRGRTGARDRRQHLGLGLYIVEKIVSAHGGTVDAVSAEATGTTFTIRLPRVAAMTQAVRGLHE